MIQSDLSSISDVERAQIFQLRAQIATGQVEQAIASAKKEHGAPHFAAVKAFALYVKGNTAAGLQELEELLNSAPDSLTVNILGATVLQAAGRSEEALALLNTEDRTLEA